MKPLITAISLLLATHAMADQQIIDDSDLSPRLWMQTPEVAASLGPDSISVVEDRSGGFSIRFLRSSNGQLEAVEGLPLTFQVGSVRNQGITFSDGSYVGACEPGDRIAVQAELKNARLEVMSRRDGVYTIDLEVSCGTTTTLVFEPDSNGGQAIGIWNIGRRAERWLSEAVDMGFWKRRIRFLWPSDGDYYSFGQVHVTRGDHWDVVGHELGHALYDLANIGVFAGGAHRIDECYTDRLAASEGWASFFSAWLGVDLADPDAKFEYMVPRRAPIRFETVPEDVCAGHKNEWRVTAFLWDLIDFNRDSESVEEPFSRVWNALAWSASRSAVDFAMFLERAGFSPEVLDLAWELNFLTKRPR